MMASVELQSQAHVATATAPVPAPSPSPTPNALSEESTNDHVAAEGAHASHACAPNANGLTRDTSEPSAPGDGRYAQYHAALQAAWPDLPRLTISYKELGYQTQVAARTKEVPNLASAAASLVQSAFRCASNQARSVSFDALKGATGVIRPGDMTLILAPPGHGKSMLLKALAGRFAAGGDEARSLRGEVRWNGRTADELAADAGPKLSKLCAFVDQGEVHYPMSVDPSQAQRDAIAHALSLRCPAALLRFVLTVADCSSLLSLFNFSCVVQADGA
jgi:hypothetical protein